ncbi:MAG: class I SAM-dependent methyltransferase [Gemmatimonadaceae bacterium]|nr:class I SAM-dependent methyltransferase [Gemmatimonadaceae bacterium]NUS32515.1 class I SAM-dependent methyltransferase [Gemmatimonadaceae bacterium]
MTSSSSRVTTSLPAPTPAELDGIELYGDHFSPAEVSRWFADEAEAYAQMQQTGETGRGGEEYSHLHRYHAASVLTRHSEGGTLLALGPGDGDELETFARSGKWRIFAVEASATLRAELTRRFPGITVLSADTLGTLPVPDASIDLFMAFGVLHHIPNVSKVLREIARVLRAGGSAILREPGSAMGDWRGHRQGCTAHERGMTLGWMERSVAATTLRFAEPARPCLFRPWIRIAQRLGVDPLSPVGVRVDSWLATVTRWNARYRRRHWWDRFAPGAYIYLLRKEEGGTE